MTPTAYPAMRVIGLAGWSGAGKTTLMVRLVPELVRRGLTVSTMKHAHHGFDVDQPGKDSYRHREAGATEVLVASDAAGPCCMRTAMRRKPGGGADAPHDAGRSAHRRRLQARGHDKLEIHRRETGNPLLYPEDRHIVAVLSDEPLPGCPLPVIGIDDVGAIADFIIAHCGLAAVRAAAGH